MKKKTLGAASMAVSPPASVHHRLASRCIEAPGRLSITVRRPLAIRQMLTILADCPNVLLDGDEVKLGLCLSGSGMLLLSDGPDGTTCLSPSRLLPPLRPRRHRRLQPDGPGWLPVGGPAGRYVLILICATKPLPARFVDRWQDRRPAPMPQAELQSLCRWLDGQAQPARIAATPYVVLI